MTAEQKEAIKICTHYKNILYACNCEEGTERTGKAIETVLNLIQEKDKEIEKYKKLYQKALDNTVKTDKENIDLKKQIDLMAEEIRKTILIVKPESKFCQYEEDCKNIRCKDCIKQFFEKQAKEI